MKKSGYMILAAILVCVLLTGCTIEVQEEAKKEENSYYFYFLNKEETKLKRDEYEPKEETAEFMIQDLMQRLNLHSLEGEFINLLPEGVEMNSYKIDEAVLTIDFSSSYSKMSNTREVLVRAGVVRTFLQVPGIASVHFTVNGKELKDSKGEAVGAMTNSSFAEFAGSEEDAYCYDTFTLYFTDKSGKKLLEEQRTVRYKRNIPRETVILEQLMKGPMEKGHYPTIPENTGIINVMTSDRTCYVNLDHVFSDYALDVQENIPIYSVVNSLLASVDADRVQITLGMDSEGTFGEKMSLYHFYEKNEDLVNKEE